MRKIADDKSISFLRQDSRRRGCYNTVSCVPFQNKQTFVFTNCLFGGMDWKKNFSLQRKMYKKLHVQITWPTAYHNIFTHLKDLTSQEKREVGVKGSPARLAWMVAFLCRSQGYIHPELFVYHEENIWVTKYLILSHFGGKVLLPSRIRLSHWRLYFQMLDFLLFFETLSSTELENLTFPKTGVEWDNEKWMFKGVKIITLCIFLRV